MAIQEQRPTLPRPEQRRIENGELTVDVVPGDEVCLVQVSGELDLGTAYSLEAEMQRLITSDDERIILDLEQLTFMDSTGLRCLLRMTRHSRASGDPLRVFGACGQVEHLLAITGAEAALPMLES